VRVPSSPLASKMSEVADSAPAFLTVIDEMIRVADLTIIPTKASMLDIMGMADMVTLANEAG
jgi:cellulose biosynthesis protein BcsQ